MTGFYARYLIIGVLALATVWVTVPELKKQGSLPDSVLALVSGDREPGGMTSDASDGGQPAAVTELPQGQPAQQAVSVETLPANSYRATEDQPEQPERTPEVPPRPAYSYAEPQPEPSVPPQPAGPVYDWGLLAETTNSYTSSGTSNGKLSAGTVVERISTHESSHGTLLRCRVLRQQRWGETVYVPATAVIMFAGPFVEAPVEDRNLLVRYFLLRGKIDDRSSTLRDRAVRANPHFQQYQAAAKALTEFTASSKGLIERRDAATGLEKSRLEDDLRRLKAREAQILHNFRQAEGPYKRWRSRNDDGSAAIAGDSEINAWENEMMKLEPRVRGMVSGL